MSTGVPIKLLHEAEQHIVTIELKSGEMFRGKLVSAEDNMNCQLRTITVTAKDGRQSTLEYAFIRGSKIRWIIVPDMLQNAPMFQRVNRAKGLGLGAGRAQALERARQRGGVFGRGRGDGGGRGRGR